MVPIYTVYLDGLDLTDGYIYLIRHIIQIFFGLQVC